MKSGLSLLTKTLIVLGLTMFAGSSASAQDQNAMMTPPPAMSDSVLLNFVGGVWCGDLTMGDQTIYGEGLFALGVGQQWIEGSFAVWTDKTKATALPMIFVLYLRPGATAGTYKAVQIVADGSVGTATVTKSGDNLTFAWTHDNGMKETGTLTKMGPDHIVYKASIADGAGNKIMEFQHDMQRTKGK